MVRLLSSAVIFLKMNLNKKYTLKELFTSSIIFEQGGKISILKQIKKTEEHYNNNLDWILHFIGHMMAYMYNKQGEKTGHILYNDIIKDKEIVENAPFINDSWLGAFKETKIVSPYTIFAMVSNPSIEKKTLTNRINEIIRILWKHTEGANYIEFMPQFKSVEVPENFATAINYYPGLLHKEEVAKQMWKMFSNVTLSENPTQAFDKQMWDAAKGWYRVGINTYSILLHYFSDEFFYPLTKRNIRDLLNAGRSIRTYSDYKNLI